MSIGFNWRHHNIGPLRPCVLCGRPALMRNEDNDPCHKMCAEALAEKLQAKANTLAVTAPPGTGLHGATAPALVDVDALAALLRNKETELRDVAAMVQLHLDGFGIDPGFDITPRETP